MEHPHRPPSPNGFTLLEMAVVVSVIGLLIGGVLVGKNMYRSAKIQETMTKAAEFGNALTVFRTTYNAIPGDMHNATDYWGFAGGAAPYTSTTCTNINALSLSDIRATCNGNGNGTLGDTSTFHYERFRAYQHMANAGLIKGRFSGITTSGGTARYTAGVNSLAGPLQNSLYGFTHIANTAGSATELFSGMYFGTIVVGAQTSDVFLNYSGALFTPSETASIDEKLDDGAPGKGNIIPAPPDRCTNASTFPVAVYDTPEAYTIQYLKNNTIGCAIYWRNFL